MNSAKTRKIIKNLLAILWVAFQIYVGLVGGIPTIVQRLVHVSFATSLVFVTKPCFKPKNKKTEQLAFIIDITMTFVIIAFLLYGYINGKRLMNRVPYIDDVYQWDVILGIAFILLLLEAGRRNMGISMPIICIVFIVYAFTGPYFSGMLRHRGLSITALVETLSMGTQGIFGSPIGVSTNTVFYFMLFGAFLAATPAGKMFISLARFITQKTTGGSGKTTILTCALFGMISGSAAANVATTGVITYPMMEKAGFKPRFAASILAIAGTGGQLFPPIMGAAAFIMADAVGIGYFQIAVYAILPSLLYILALYYLVHFQAKKQGLKTEPVVKAELISDIKKHIILLTPLILLIFLIVNGRSLMYSAIISIGLLVILCALQKETRMSIKQIIDTLISGAMSAMTVALPCALAGIVIGVLVKTGIALRFSSMIAQFASNSIFLALLLAMGVIIILGMGMPSSAAYVMSATLLAPAIIKLGIPVVVAHMFIFYFSNLSMITPPVALASFTAAGIAKTGLWKTGLEAFKYSIAVFTIPFIFIFDNALLGMGSILDIIIVVGTTSLGVISLAASLVGFFKGEISILIRVWLFVASVLLVIPETISDIIGITMMFVVFVLQIYKRKKRPMLISE